MNNRNKKRLLIFVLIPLIAIIPLFTDDLSLKIIAILVLVIYAGFIIFLRDSVKGDPPTSQPDEKIDITRNPSENYSSYSEDEGFTIISGSKQVEVLTADHLKNSTSLKNKNIFKPADLKQVFEKIATEDMPSGISQDEQFEFVLEKVLAVVKEAFLAHSAVFFWYNKKKERLTLEKYISSSGDIKKQKFELEDDILSKIVQKEEPELLTDIMPNAEADVIRYYSAPQGIKSFVGVPLFYERTLAGVLALDSKVIDAFGIESVYSLGRIVRVISIIISLFDEKFNESQTEQRLESLLGILSNDKKFTSQNELFATLEIAVKNLIYWDAFTFVYYEPVEAKFKTSKIINKTSLKYVGENLEIEIQGTLAGKAISSGMPVKIDDTSAQKYYRFSSSEDVRFDGSFLALPLIYDDQNFGVLCFESLKKNIYTNSDIKFMKSTVKFFSFILYTFSTQNVLRNLISVDVETQMLNYKAFMERTAIDLLKSAEFNAPGAVALIKIDDFIEQESLFEGDPFPKVLEAISKMIIEETGNLNIIGRIDDRVFGVFFFNTNSKDVFLWAEKLRIKVARKPITVVTKQTTFTVSIGIASTAGKTDVEEVLKNADLALSKAVEKGGNSVKSL